MCNLLHPRVNGSALITARACVQQWLDQGIISVSELTVVHWKRMTKAMVGECTDG